MAVGVKVAVHVAVRAVGLPAGVTERLISDPALNETDVAVPVVAELPVIEAAVPPAVLPPTATLIL